MTTAEVLLAGVIGLLAGVLGGLAGIGGSMVMLPGLALLIGYDDRAHTAHHAFMAAAMCVNVVVAIPAAHEHRRAGLVRGDLLRIVMPSMALAMIAGVLASNRLGGELLRLVLAGFIGVYAVFTIARAFGNAAASDRPESPGSARPIASGLAAGFVGGLLGLGGGVVLVPMLQLLARVPLRRAIATSSASMAITSILGAGLKLASLPSLHRDPMESIWLALAMAPGAVLGSVLGARLAHALPITALRIVIAVLLMLAAARMAGVG